MLFFYFHRPPMILCKIVRSSVILLLPLPYDTERERRFSATGYKLSERDVRHFSGINQIHNTPLKRSAHYNGQ